MSAHLRPLSVLDDPPKPLAEGDVVLGRYEIQRTLGHGGMATVYLARHQQTDRLVALKLLDPEISRDPSYVERFRREAKAAGRIRSDHVVAIYDFDADEHLGSLVLVMEYLEGASVQQAMRAGRMDPTRALLFGRQMLEGLAAAHNAGVVHRDLKPANLYLERTAAGLERLKILDFGISKIADGSQQELTRAGQTLGTVAYMAPEQVRGRVSGPDPRVDLYSAGVSIFVMLSGRRPIDAEDTVALLTALMEREPLTLQQAAGVVFHPALEAFMERALRKDPAYRFQTALEMREALVQAAQAMGIAPAVMASGAAAVAGGASGMFGAVFRPSAPGTPIVTGATPGVATGMFGAVPTALPPSPMAAMDTGPVSGMVLKAPPPSRVPTEVLSSISTSTAEISLALAQGTASPHSTTVGLEGRAPKRSGLVVALALLGIAGLGGAAFVVSRGLAPARAAVVSPPEPSVTALAPSPNPLVATSANVGATASAAPTAALAASALASASAPPGVASAPSALAPVAATAEAAPSAPPEPPQVEQPAAAPLPTMAAPVRPTSEPAPRTAPLAPTVRASAPAPRPSAAPRPPRRRRGIIEDAPF